MLITNVRITNFKSINDSGLVEIEPDVTALVGQNEAGKTAFLKALEPASPAVDGVQYNATRDYPRKNLARDKRDDKVQGAEVATVTYALTDEEREDVNDDLGFPLLDGFTFTRTAKYAGRSTVGVSLNKEAAFVRHVVAKLSVPDEQKESLSKQPNVRRLLAELEAIDKTDAAKAEYEKLEKRFPEPTTNGWGRLDWWLWEEHLKPGLPKHLYFDEYRVLPAKTSLPALQKRIKAEETTEADDTVLRLLDLAGVEVDDLLDPDGYEQSTAQLESSSAEISEKIFDYWRQNKTLEVVFDVDDDPKDVAPFNDGKNLYVRIKNTRHKVTMPFDQRSKGFIWFFSFLVWFDSMQRQMDQDVPLVLLLDEPGLNLHALAQADFLRYIEDKSADHQILYTTHSPFMVDSAKLHRARAVEDDAKKGTTVTSDLSGSSSDTLFPLQAALGYSIAQNLFIGERNLLVEGISDLVLLQTYSELLEEAGRPGLNEAITVTPTGGVKKIPTFISLFGANRLKSVVLHDYEGHRDQQLEHAIRSSLIREKDVLQYATFRGGKGDRPTDVEDLIEPALYLQRFNAVFDGELGRKVAEKDLPDGDRIVQRLTDWLKREGVTLRASGGYNHHRVAKDIAASPPAAKDVPADTLDRFEALFKKINGLLK